MIRMPRAAAESVQSVVLRVSGAVGAEVRAFLRNGGRLGLAAARGQKGRCGQFVPCSAPATFLDAGSRLPGGAVIVDVTDAAAHASPSLVGPGAPRRPHAYRRMRLGKSDEGPAAANRRPELKPTDQNGAGILADVPNRIVGNVIEARRIAPQLLGQLMSDTDVEFRDMVARDVPYQWLPAVVNGPDASVGFEIARSPLPEAPTALRHGPDRQVYLEAASCISAIELTNRAGGEGEVMRDLACDGSGMPACPLGSGA